MQQCEKYIQNMDIYQDMDIHAHAYMYVYIYTFMDVCVLLCTIYCLSLLLYVSSKSPVRVPEELEESINSNLPLFRCLQEQH